jgi:hypothetical protein
LDEGKTSEEVSKSVGLSMKAVSKWRRRFAELGIKGLADAPGCRTKKSLPPEKVKAVIEKAAYRGDRRTVGTDRRTVGTVPCKRVVVKATTLSPHRPAYSQSFCFSVSYTIKRGVGIGEFDPVVGLLGSLGDETFVGEGTTVTEGIGLSAPVGPSDADFSGGVSFPVPGTGSGNGVSFGGGNPFGLSLGKGVNLYNSKTCTGKVGEAVVFCDIPSHYPFTMFNLLLRARETYRMAVEAAAKDGWGKNL